MIVVKLNKFERVAGLFVVIAIVLSVSALLGFAIKKGWLESKVSYEIIFPSADGLREGADVQISGIRAGSIERVNLVSATEVRVEIAVFEKYKDYIRKDSQVRLIRPFIIGEKVVEVTMGSKDQDIIEVGGLIGYEQTFDFMDLMSGRKMGAVAESVESYFESLKFLVDAFTNQERVDKIVALFDELLPLTRNLNMMAEQMTVLGTDLNKDKNTKKMIQSLSVLTKEMEGLLPVIALHGPQMMDDFPRLVSSLAVLSEEMKKITPAIGVMAPDLPRAGLRAIEALDEAVVLIKAMQRNFFIRGKVEEVREEENQRRVPSSLQEDYHQ